MKLFVLLFILLALISCDSIPHRTREQEVENFQRLENSKSAFEGCLPEKKNVTIKFDFYVFKKFEWFEPKVKGFAQEKMVKGREGIKISLSKGEKDISPYIQCLKNELMKIEFIIRDSRMSWENFIFDLDFK